MENCCTSSSAGAVGRWGTDAPMSPDCLMMEVLDGVAQGSDGRLEGRYSQPRSMRRLRLTAMYCRAKTRPLGPTRLWPYVLP